MKHFLSLFLILVSSFAATAADTVLVLNETTVTVNGQNWGKPADVIANNPQLAPAVQLALEAWAADLRQAEAEAEAALAAKTARISSVLQAKLTDEIKTGEGPKTALLRELMAEAAKTDAQLKLEQAQAVEAAAVAARKAAEAEAAKLSGN